MFTRFQKRVIFVLLIAIVATFAMIPIKKQYFSKKHNVATSRTVKNKVRKPVQTLDKSRHAKSASYTEAKRKRMEDIRAGRGGSQTTMSSEERRRRYEEMRARRNGTQPSMSIEERRRQYEEMRNRRPQTNNPKSPNALDYMAPGYGKAQERLKNVQNLRQRAQQEHNRSLQNIK